MSATVYDLIGQIINPSPRSQAAVQPQMGAAAYEPVHVLIGRILAGPVSYQPALQVQAPARPERELEVPAVAM